jgi:hypothetical protein
MPDFANGTTSIDISADGSMVKVGASNDDYGAGASNAFSGAVFVYFLDSKENWQLNATVSQSRSRQTKLRSPLVPPMTTPVSLASTTDPVGSPFMTRLFQIGRSTV